MAYQALYRKYRPKDFSDVKGQEAVVTTLKNQLSSGRIGHAYLFCGTRGTGKTTVAKILAKAMNCTALTENGPCGECDRCRSIEDGSSMNVVEIDGASNNGVADVRQIVEEVAYAPIDGGRKVYIIDEVHMLSESAFNALLKTLEEPPEYLTFILATTDPQKVIPTIVSRCQRYDFKRIPADVITKRLKELLDREGVTAEERALSYIARVADGALRDALSILEECISYYFKEELTFDKVLNVVGSVDQTVFHELTESLISGRTDDVIETTERLVSSGRDLTQFASEYVWYLRNLLIVKSAEDPTGLIDLSDENIEILKKYSDILENEQIIRYIHVMSRLISDMKRSSNKRVEFEIALIRLTHPQMERDFDSMIDRIKVMERDLEMMKDKLEAGVYAAADLKPASDQTGGTASYGAQNETARPVIPARPPAIPEDVKEIVRNWKHIEQAVSSKGSPMMAINISDALLSVDDVGSLVLGLKEPVALAYFVKDRSNLDTLMQIIEETTGKHVNVVIKDVSDARTRVETVDITELVPGVPVEIIDD